MADETWTQIGVDRDGGNWIAVGFSPDDDIGAAVFDSIDELWAEHGDDADRIVVDVPIGLCDPDDASSPCCKESDEELSRRCDDLARGVIGGRHSSVFTAPCREVARKADDGASYEEVNETNKDQTGKGLTQQAANIADCIMEVDELLQGEGDQDILVEGHPEVCFRAFADEDLAHSKKTASGVDERLRLLESTTEYGDSSWRDLTRELTTEGYSVGLDDLLDALVLAVTAVASEDEFQTLPEGPPEDTTGLPMQMVYRRAEPFDVE
ncbi:Predicted nuclease (RNAse H fold) [Halomicrobium zhouii]|uniref:Predicted nuclease (RNAse H fold) n=1 Tax=Halomicrobium zhouii TaxID=767519 RepID=A0A1I6L2I4_9EURY|nr:DUF429 domain-containing protein [Halomicrobium zhouii]SFR97651.1 Predicted nuclease (RNAse H fold) [Halomicrobium zhouii]